MKNFKKALFIIALSLINGGLYAIAGLLAFALEAELACAVALVSFFLSSYLLYLFNEKF